MGWNEEIFVLRENYPIAYLDYKGYVVFRVSDEMKFTKVDDYTRKMSGKEFNSLLEELKREEVQGIQKYVLNYFEDLEILPDDLIFVYGG